MHFDGSFIFSEPPSFKAARRKDKERLQKVKSREKSWERDFCLEVFSLELIYLEIAWKIISRIIYWKAGKFCLRRFCVESFYLEYFVRKVSVWNIFVRKLFMWNISSEKLLSGIEMEKKCCLESYCLDLIWNLLA